ncbi:uncharacterized protein SPPG_08474 [Spizellomyces punctatus DAOM BR117]|uniref:Uncharacterized protein n=1 Tax=Spizellomyces punctatus (strain DAOM BR117) TaxID=645134 RepID=A0A0L0H5B8_SPIPD|nr:uncharacterized protein SPPG_08474 [Spizellomyces punctatus DAOM BR117]KNC96086.1 hypothetical protein SPPG_08474 [Spizellomyces punctatus DAOM BR117]|eukprot:XP_016604126.1 hypothetical protein SPPG_08474 [Spizellomyces punctatus DAOM BR117]
MDSATLESRRREAFKQLKPICVDVMNPHCWTTTTRDANNRLVALLDMLHVIGASECGASVLGGLVEYVTFPILQLFSYPSASLSALECGLECLLYLLEMCPGEAVPLQLYRELLVTLPFIISQGTVSKAVRNGRGTSEEVKGLGVRCLLALVKKPAVPPTVENEQCEEVDRVAIRDTTDKELSRSEYQPAVAHVVVVLLDLIEKERNLRLQVSAIDTLSRVVQQLREPDIVAQFLPGISSTLAKTITKDAKDSHRIIVGCLNLLLQTIVLVMSDDACEHLLPKQKPSWADLVELAQRIPSMDDRAQNLRPPLHAPATVADSSEPQPKPYIVRDAHWHKNTVIRLNKLFTRIFTIRSHDQWKIRLGFLRFASNVALHCSCSLGLSIPLLVETLLCYVNDEYPLVANECRAQIEVVAAKIRDQYSVTSILKETFFSYMMTLPRQMMQTDDGRKLESLHIANGYLMLLKGEINKPLGAVMNHVSLGLLKILTFDSSEVKLVEDRVAESSIGFAIMDMASEVPERSEPSTGKDFKRFAYMFPRKRFQYFRNDKVTLAISQMCRLLGYYGDLESLVDHFLGHLRSIAFGDYQPQAIYILNEICLGAAGVGVEALSYSNGSEDRKASMMPIIKSVVREYLDSPILKLPTNLADLKLLKDLRRLNPDYLVNEPDSAPMSGTFNAVIQKTSLILEGVAVMAAVAGADFRLLLMDTLYAILENVGDPNRTVSDSAMATLIAVAEACEYHKSTQPSSDSMQGPREMILQNVDYIVNIVSRRLRYIAQNPRAPLVLKAAIRIAGIHIVPYMDDSVDEILDALDHWHNENGLVVFNLIGVLKTLMDVMCEDASVPVEKETSRDERSESVCLAPIIDERAPFELSACSQEMLGFYLECKPSVEERRTPNQQNRGQASIGDIEKFFTDRKSGEFEGVTSPGRPISSPDDLGQSGDKFDMHGTSDERADGVGPPSHVQSLALKIVNKLYHYHSSANPRLRVQSLRIFHSSLAILRLRSNDLNPTIHKFWPIITRRLGDEEHYVVFEALIAVATMCRLSPDFVVKRVADDLIPRFEVLAKSLQRAVERTYAGEKEGSHRAHRDVHHRVVTSQQMKVYVASLTTMAELLLRVQMSNNSIFRIVTSVVPFLNSRWYTQEVTEGAVGVLKAAANCRHGQDIVWLSLWAVMGGQGVQLSTEGTRATTLREGKIPKWMAEHWRGRGKPEDFIPAGMEVLNSFDGKATCELVANAFPMLDGTSVGGLGVAVSC